ncbi:LysR family transcriptional regulator [Rhodobacteraceae bacterium N5(2021)]|uniref:LysR family transcriptional regulator n=1 Tax=Gymnodinialimonas phycosphaerae TaxID=2841589 RepID=A0A975TXR8_9RHOB|nr:LysR family transcriptional regulator [Gymnodinialimonas phycosphaerae]MBY4892662.1 LysR family transcriptional regulator [Gymnodinialimonas phycosphaerae]
MTNINNIRMFTRVFELENMSAAARDLQVSAAVASSRIGELEKSLGIRLFTRTTRSIQPTEQGRIFYPKALKVLEALDEAEAAVHEITLNPRGSIFVSAPLGIGRRYIAPFVALFREKYPEVHTRLRLSDRALDLTGEGLDVAFVIGNPPDSGLMMKPVATLPRVLCAAPEYIARRGAPVDAADLINKKHDCLLLRFPGSTEFRWSLYTSDGFQRFDVTGPFACDDGDVLTNWALDGRGIVNKPRFEVQEHLDNGALVQVCPQSPPPNAQLALLYPHKKNQDPKSRFFMDFMSEKLRAALG